MNLKSLIDKKNIILNLNVESKKRLIEFFANRVADTYPGISEDLVIKNIYNRERIGSTYIGKNIYMPHCRVDNLIVTKLIIVTLKNAYYDDSIKDYIKVAVGVFFPDKVTEVHMILLKQLALYLKSEKAQKYLYSAKSPEELYKLIINA